MSSTRDARRGASEHRSSPSGLPIYRFAYKTDPARFYRGTMAQDLLSLKPEAVVVGSDGFYRVKYDLLDIEFVPVA